MTTTETTLTRGDIYAAEDLRTARPTAKDIARERANGIDAMGVWLDDIEHTIVQREIPAPLRAEFRRRCGHGS